nr:class I SAM-dependent methyltransferase [uncultured Methanoregula sp.]
MEPLIPGPVPVSLYPRYWRDLWRQKKLDQSRIPEFESADAYWNNRNNVTDLYVRSRARESWQGKKEAQLKAMQIPAGSRVLDIGGGSGTHAIPLAEMGCEVTVIEPSGAMREELQKNLARSGVGNITVIPSRWEDVSISELGDPFDAVIASYSLSMTDIGEAIEKMQACCRGRVHLFWFLTPPSWARVSRDLWPRLHGREYPGELLADSLWQVLYEMGIYANLTTERKKATVYQDVDEVVREYYQRLNCSTIAHEEILKDYFTQKLRPCDKGFVLNGVSYSAHLWWNAGNR